MAKKTRIKQGWHKEDIKAAIRKRYGSITALAEQSGVASCYLRVALMRPQPKAEGIIARSLGESPAELWPERYTEEVMNNHRHWRRHDNLNVVKYNATTSNSNVNR